MPARSNQDSARAFAEQFDPPLTVARTERVNDVPKKDAYVVAFWDEQRSLGITAVFYDRKLKAYLETRRSGTDAEAVAQTFARILDMERQP